MQYFTPMPIPSVQAKLNRAYEHIKQFRVLFADVMRGNPYAVAQEKDTSGIEKPRTYLGKLPFDVTCTAGDAIHNLHCALDHLAYAVAIKAGLKKGLLGSVYFPSRKTRKEFDAAIKEAVVADCRQPWVDFLSHTEPYTGGNGEHLYRIKRLDKIDKHRELLTLHPFLRVTTRRRNGLVSQRIISLENGIPGELPSALSKPDAMVMYSPEVTFADVPFPQGARDALVELLEFAQTVEETMVRALRDNIVPVLIAAHSATLSVLWQVYNCHYFS